MVVPSGTMKRAVAARTPSFRSAVVRLTGITAAELEVEAKLDGEEIDGAKVWDFVRDGHADKVAIYCQADVERVRSVYRRINFEAAQEWPEVVSA